MGTIVAFLVVFGVVTHKFGGLVGLGTIATIFLLMPYKYQPPTEESE